jgi:hypothetical protein
MGEMKFVKPAKPRVFSEERDSWILDIPKNGTVHFHDVKIFGEIKRNGHRLYLSNKFSLSSGNFNLHLDFLEKHVPEGYMLDGEVGFKDLTKNSGDVAHAIAEGNSEELFYFAFDILATPSIPQQELAKYPLWRRKEILWQLCHAWNSEKILYNATYVNGFREVLAELESQNGEGMVFKYADRPNKAGSRANMIKYKFRQDYDVVIVDCKGKPTEWRVKPGEVGADGILYPEGRHSDPWLAGYVGLRYGLYDAKTGELVVLGSLGITGPKEKMETYIGRVAIVRANAQFPSGCLQHPQTIGWREPWDKPATDCKFDFEKGEQV